MAIRKMVNGSIANMSRVTDEGFCLPSCTPLSACGKNTITRPEHRIPDNLQKHAKKGAWIDNTELSCPVDTRPIYCHYQQLKKGRTIYYRKWPETHR
jgi:hypothetical protein